MILHKCISEAFVVSCTVIVAKCIKICLQNSFPRYKKLLRQDSTTVSTSQNSLLTVVYMPLFFTASDSKIKAAANILKACLDDACACHLQLTKN